MEEQLKHKLLITAIALEWAVDQLDDVTGRDDFLDLASTIAKLKANQLLADREKQRYYNLSNQYIEEPIFPPEPEIPTIEEDFIEEDYYDSED
ncbi:MAG: hypothetical protein F6K45_07565 [Kamptonema sp. SIO1D9]|nr:hypothetical protein [Kamptonema sp. SIO1D9]